MKFVILKNDSGNYWWRVVSGGNNETLAQSEMLNSKQACMNAIELVQRGAAMAEIDDRTDD